MDEPSDDETLEVPNHVQGQSYDSQLSPGIAVTKSHQHYRPIWN